MSKKNIIITGVSTGIGHATALQLLREGHCIFGSLRGQNEQVIKKLQDAGSFHPLFFDVRDLEKINIAVQEVRQEVGERGIDVLINNAGFALPGPLSHLPIKEIKDQFEINVFSWINITNAVLPLLKKNTNSNKKIINISSTSSKFTSPFLGAYAMSKSATESMTDAYRRELKIYEIDAITIQPGPVKTKIWEKSVGALDRFADTDYGYLLNKADQEIKSVQNAAIPVDKVAHLISKIIHNRKTKTRYMIMKNAWTLKLFLLLPARWADQLIWAKFKMSKK